MYFHSVYVELQASEVTNIYTMKASEYNLELHVECA